MKLDTVYIDFRFVAIKFFKTVYIFNFYKLESWIKIGDPFVDYYLNYENSGAYINYMKRLIENKRRF